MNLHLRGKNSSKKNDHTKSILVNAPAKLNLFLDVFDKRPDGYHGLVTLFERITLFDRIRLTPLSDEGIVVSSESPDIPLDENNLVYKAADLIKRSRGIRQGIKIEIEKNIPVGAGLGGGSSNAAAVLLALNKIFSLKLTEKTLIAYANRLGSDVAFFVFDRNFAIGRDRGGALERVPLSKNVKLWHLLFVPRVKIITKDVYFLLDQEKKNQKSGENAQNSLKLTKNGDNVNILISSLKNGDLCLLNRNIYNRLSPTVMKSYRLVSELKTDLLKLGLEDVHMSGSGPTLFMNFAEKSDAQAIFQRIHDRISDRCGLFLVSTL